MIKQQPNRFATPAQSAANRLFLALGMDVPFTEIEAALHLAGFNPTADDIEAGWEDAQFDIEHAAELAACADDWRAEDEAERAEYRYNLK